VTSVTHQEPRVSIRIDGRPSTKKTSQRIVLNHRTGKRFVIPSSRTIGWTAAARVQMMEQYRGKVIDGPVHVVYVIYRQWERGDLGGFEAAIDDALQGIIIRNDSQIVSRTSFKLLDKSKPRVEVTVERAA
jgi:Holliday junction resolvase RusA-like endonuclease